MSKFLTTKKEQASNIIRNTRGLRSALIDEMDSIRQGKSNTTRANAMSKLATAVLDCIRIEMEVEKHKTKFIDQAGKPSNMIVSLDEGDDALESDANDTEDKI